MMKLFVPGKLFVAGEYAVVHPGSHGIVMAINWGMTFLITGSDEYEIHAGVFEGGLTRFQVNDDGPVWHEDLEGHKFMREAIQMALDWLSWEGCASTPFSLMIDSTLMDQAGLKYGLGSSAALTVGVIAAIIYHNTGRLPGKSELFKMGVIAHYKAQKGGSGADIAAAVYGGVLHYQMYDNTWLKQQLEDKSKLKQLVHITWPLLRTKKIGPLPCSFLVGWSGEKADTAKMLANYAVYEQEQPELADHWIKMMDLLTNQVLLAINENNLAHFHEAIHTMSRHLTRLGTAMNKPVMTENLEKLCKGSGVMGSAKPSGAGGGDCGLYFYNNATFERKIRKQWQGSEISPLGINLWEQGVTLLSS